MALVVWTTSPPLQATTFETGKASMGSMFYNLSGLSISDLVRLIVLQDAKMQNAR